MRCLGPLCGIVIGPLALTAGAGLFLGSWPASPGPVPGPATAGWAPAKPKAGTARQVHLSRHHVRGAATWRASWHRRSVAR
jgi:hypothetical protein